MESTFLSINAAPPRFPIANSRIAHLQLNQFGSVSLSRARGMAFRGAVKYRNECLASGGGGSDGLGGSGGGGGGGGGGGETNFIAATPLVDDVSAFSSDVIILQVGGMTCGGCAASVKRILESQPHVSSANVDLTTEVATVWPASDAKDGPNWQVQLGEALANHLTNCGFKSQLKGQGSNEGGILS